MHHDGWTDHGGEGEQVAFLIGMRWSELWRLAAKPWVAAAFAAMLGAGREQGVLATRLEVRPAGPVVVQRWRDEAALHAWARDGGEAHLAPWRRFRRQEGATRDWGVWHEVRRV